MPRTQNSLNAFETEAFKHASVGEGSVSETLMYTYRGTCQLRRWALRVKRSSLDESRQTHAKVSRDGRIPFVLEGLQENWDGQSHWGGKAGLLFGPEWGEKV